MKKEIKEIFTTLTNKKVHSLEEITTGFSNKNYLVNNAYVLRIPSDFRDESLHYDIEKKVYEKIEKLNISEKIVVFCQENGIKISKFIHQAKPYEQALNDNQIVFVARLLKKLHHQKIEVDFDYDIIGRLDFYKSKIDKKDWIDKHHENSIIKELSKFYYNDEFVLCHNDLVHGNMLFRYNKLFLIDWEYAAMNNPYFDLASVISENNLNSDQEDFFLKAYFGFKYSDLIKKRVELVAKFQDILFYYWAKYLSLNRSEKIFLDIATEKLSKIQKNINSK